mgnify:CR=1 FL=1
MGLGVMTYYYPQTILCPGAVRLVCGLHNGWLRADVGVMQQMTVSSAGQCPKRNLRFVHEHDKNDDFLPFLFMNTKEIAL